MCVQSALCTLSAESTTNSDRPATLTGGVVLPLLFSTSDWIHFYQIKCRQEKCVKTRSVESIEVVTLPVCYFCFRSVRVQRGTEPQRQSTWNIWNITNESFWAVKEGLQDRTSGVILVRHENSARLFSLSCGQKPESVLNKTVWLCNSAAIHLRTAKQQSRKSKVQHSEQESPLQLLINQTVRRGSVGEDTRHYLLPANCDRVKVATWYFIRPSECFLQQLLPCGISFLSVLLSLLLTTQLSLCLRQTNGCCSWKHQMHHFPCARIYFQERVYSSDFTSRNGFCLTPLSESPRRVCAHNRVGFW